MRESDDSTKREKSPTLRTRLSAMTSSCDELAQAFGAGHTL